MTHSASDQPTDCATQGDFVNTPHPDATDEFMSAPADTDPAPAMNGGNVVQFRPDSAATSEVSIRPVGIRRLPAGEAR
jgi:hypothetical protein